MSHAFEFTGPSSTTAPPLAREASGLAPSPLFLRFQKALPAMQALSREELLTINVDLAALVLVLQGKLPAVLALRSEFAKLPRFDLALFDGLEDYASALFYAQAMYVTDTPPERPLAPLAERCAAHLATLHVACEALLDRGLLPRELLRTARKTSAHDKLVLHTQALVERLRAAWPTVGTRTALEPADLSAAEDAARELGDALSARAAAEARVAEAAELRQRAFTLLARAWDEVRRGVFYLRWHEGEEEQLAPSLYAGRNNHRPATAAAGPAKGRGKKGGSGGKRGSLEQRTEEPGARG